MNEQVEALEKKIYELNEELFKLRSEVEPQIVSGKYTFQTLDGQATLADLFGGKSELIVVHNMGRSCDYCTMWADGFESMRRHLESRLAFVISSPDSPERQAEVREERGWTMSMVQDADKAFTRDMGYWSEASGWYPGASAFIKNDDGTIARTGKTFFGPGDAYCPTWQFFSLFPGGAGSWEPK